MPEPEGVMYPSDPRHRVYRPDGTFIYFPDSNNGGRTMRIEDEASSLMVVANTDPNTDRVGHVYRSGGSRWYHAEVSSAREYPTVEPCGCPVHTARGEFVQHARS